MLLHFVIRINIPDCGSAEISYYELLARKGVIWLYWIRATGCLQIREKRKYKNALVC